MKEYMREYIGDIDNKIKSNQFKGELVSSDEGEMEWVDRDRLSEIQLVDDFEELLKVMEDEKLHEFQYIVDGDEWQVVLK